MRSLLPGSYAEASNNPSTLPAISDVGSLKVAKVEIPTLVHSLQLQSRVVGTIPKKMSGGISSISKSPNQSLISIGSWQGEITLFEPIAADGDHDTDSNSSESPQPFFTYQGHISDGDSSDPVTSLVFSADSSVLLAAWESGKLIAFNVNDGSIIHECDTPEGLFDCAISNDGKRVVIGGDFGWKMFDFEEFYFKIKDKKSQEENVRTVNFSQDGTKLIVGATGGEALGCYVYHGYGRELLATFCKGKRVFKALMSPTNMILAVGCEDKIRVFNIATGDCLHTFSIEGACQDIEFSEDGQIIFFCDDGGKNIYNLGFGGNSICYGHDVYSGAREFECQLPEGATSLASWKSTLLVPCQDENVYAINAAFEPTHRIKHEKRVWDSAVSPNGNLIVFCYQKFGVKVFDTSNNKLLWECSENVKSVSFSPCGRKIAFEGYMKIHIYDAKDGSHKKTIETPDFNWMGFLEDGNHILIFEKGETTAHVIDIDTEDKDTAEDDTLSITTSTQILSARIIPKHSICALATEDSIDFYSITNGTCILKDGLTFSWNEKQSGKLQGMDCTSDGSRIVLVFRTHLDVYNFDSNQGLDSSSMSYNPLPLQDGKEIRMVRFITISKDDKIVAFCAPDGEDPDGEDTILYTCNLEGEGDEERKVLTHSMDVDINSINFLPLSSSSSHYPLVVSCGGYYTRNYSTTLIVDAEKGGEILDPSLLFQCFEYCDDQTVNSLIPKHKELLPRRNENGKTLAELAIEEGRYSVLLKMLEVVEPSFPWIFFETFHHLINTTDENRIEHFTTANKGALPHTPPYVLEGLTKMIPTLAANGSIEIICYLLKAGSSNCASGFVSGRQMHLKAFRNDPSFRWLGSLLLNRHKPCNGRQIRPECSPSSSDIEVHRGPEDDLKRILLNAARVLLPYLCSLNVLRALVDIDLSSDEEGEDSSEIPENLKPFQCESLQVSIDAAWYNWAGTMFLCRAIYYMVWMICIMSLEYFTTKALKAAFIGVICVGWLYLVRIEAQQLRHGGLIQYIYDFWNMWQILAYCLVFLFVIFNIHDMNASTGTSILVHHKWFAGLVQFFTLINFLYYFRGVKSFSWFLYALTILTNKMYVIMTILFWILVAACCQLRKVPGAFDSKKVIPTFTDTYLIAIYGAFESSEYGDHDHEYKEASSIVLVLLIVLSSYFIIFMNAMIGVTSKYLENIMDYKEAILAREKASFIVELYNSMSKDERLRKEEECKWPYKLFKQTDLNKIENNDETKNPNGEVMKQVGGKLNSRLERMEKKNDEMKEQIDEMKLTLEKLLSAVS